MLIEVKVPVLPESVSEATIAVWHKKVGDTVSIDDNLVDIETEKVVLEVPSTVDGVIKEILFPEGATVTGQEVLMIIEENSSAVAATNTATSNPTPANKPSSSETLEVQVPVLPESVSEATIAAWHKKVGDFISADENIVDIETEKVVLEVPSTIDGIIKEILFDEGATVTAKVVIAVIEQADASTAPSSTPNTAAAQTNTSQAASLSPAVRKLVADNNIDSTQIAGTGKDGRILKEDVLKFIESPSATATPAASAPAAATPLVTPSQTSNTRSERREPMSRMRTTIARRLKEAQDTQAMLTTFNDVNLQKVIDIRSEYKEAFEKKHGSRLGFMSFFVKAAVEALRRFPSVNASIEGSDIVYHDYYDIGIAASSPRGLVVPVLRDVDQLSFAQVEQNIKAYGDKARNGKITMDDLQGGTFTISNGGVFGSMLSTPIVNPPQSAILGMHRIDQRPVAENGQVVIRPMMYLALTYDHRIIDGKQSVEFLKAIKDCLEDPARLLLEI